MGLELACIGEGKPATNERGTACHWPGLIRVEAGCGAAEGGEVVRAGIPAAEARVPASGAGGGVRTDEPEELAAPDPSIARSRPFCGARTPGAQNGRF
jgi:hypothetical protein